MNEEVWGAGAWLSETGGCRGGVGDGLLIGLINEEVVGSKRGSVDEEDNGSRLS